MTSPLLKGFATEAPPRASGPALVVPSKIAVIKELPVDRQNYEAVFLVRSIIDQSATYESKKTNLQVIYRDLPSQDVAIMVMSFFENDFDFSVNDKQFGHAQTILNDAIKFYREWVKPAHRDHNMTNNLVMMIDRLKDAGFMNEKLADVQKGMLMAPQNVHQASPCAEKN